MKKITILIVVVALAAMAIAQTSMKKATQTPTQESTPHLSAMQTGATPAATIQWVTMNEALAQSAKTKKKILIDFYTDWCGWCKVMDNKTYTDPKVIAIMNKYFLPVKFNAEKEGPITYKGKQYALQASGIRSTHTLAIELLEGQMGYPTTTILNTDHDKMINLPGYIDAQQMAAYLKYFGENKHLTTSLDEFMKKETGK